MVEDGFTPAQLAAVTAAEGPLGIIAGPGCGKTTVLAGRIAFLIRERGFDPSSILAVSFTTEAARALRAQLGQQVGAAATDVSIHTLHALGRRVIDTWAGRLGFDVRPAVLHRDEGSALLGATAADLGWDMTAFSLPELATAVDRCRLLPDDEARRAHPVSSLAEAYEERLRRHGAIDFVAMLSLPLRLFREHPETLRLLQLGYQCVLADEAQDLDATQWALIELLAAEHRHLVIVGDPVQSIYCWRGADVRHLLAFGDRHPDARMVTLAHNHRATGHLVAVANALSDLLAYRPGLVTDNAAGPAARLLRADDEHAEAAFVAHQIGALVDRGLLDHPGHAAVLYRTRAQADTLASALRAAGVPYTTHGHADLFAQRVVRDVLAYLRLACNPADRLALSRVLEAPPRGLGRLAAMLVDEPTTLAELPARAEAFGPGVTAGASALVATIYDLHADVVRGVGPAAVLDRALDRSGYRAWLEHHPNGPARLRTLARLRAIASRAEVGLGEWLDALAVGEEVDPAASDLEAARLSTIHTAKGREWRAVFLPGLEESVLPHYRALRTRDGGPDDAALEEELRVLYVALTRPRERLYLSYCRQRSRGGRAERRQPSRWLYALPPDLLAPAA